MFRRACSAGHVPPGMFRRACSAGHGPPGMFRRACSAGHGPPGMARRAWPAGHGPPGMFRRACSAGHGPPGMARRAWPAGHGPALPDCSPVVTALQPRCGPIRPRGPAVGRDRTGLPTLGPTNFPWAEQCHAQSSEQAVFPAAVRAVRRLRAVALKAGASPRQRRTYRRFARRAGGGAGAGERGLAYSAHNAGRVLPVCFCHSAGA